MYNNTMRFLEKNHNHTKEDTAKIEEEAGHIQRPSSLFVFSPFMFLN